MFCCNIRNISIFAEDAYNFLQAYKDVCECTVKTGLLKQCQKSLNQNGITILSGQQGSGKTLSAVYIMSKNKRYKRWTKLKFTSWVDLLTIELKRETLVYIDNLFDGNVYMHPEEISKWWCSLCYFYFEKIQGKTDIHLLITAKDDVMQEACEQINTNIGKIPFYLKADQFPLTNKEKKQILESQFKLAAELKGIKNPEVLSTFADIQEKDKVCAIGFPLCAHLYAFEKDPLCKTTDIFTNPVPYVIRHFKTEIENDDSNGVKTLFLFLLFYTSPGSPKPKRGLDLKYGKEICEFLKNTMVVLGNLVKEMEPLNFENLHVVAERLIYTILVKPSSMFEFKHQIYLDGAGYYFLRKYPEVAVRNFPLNIIRSYAFPDAVSSVWDNLIQRFYRELQENINLQETEMDFRSCKNMIPEVLSCKIFDKEQFEIKFREKLVIRGALNCLLSNKNLRFPFWASRFGRKTLSQTAFSFVEEHSDYQFYQSLYGECCRKKKIYFFKSRASLDLGQLKEIVREFKTADGKSILHLVLCSDRSDYEAHIVLEKMLKDISEQDTLLIKDLLNCALEQLGSSRLLCMLELIRTQDELLTKQKPTDVLNIIASLRISQVYDIHSELEFLVRICIVLANSETPTTKTNAEYNSIDIQFRHIRNLLDGNVITQFRMTKLINDCLAECSTPSLSCPKTKNIPFTNKMSDELKRAIYDSVQVLSRRNSLQRN